MVKSDKTSRPTSRKKHEDRTQAEKTAFEITSVEIQTPQTMILLLSSNEDLVVLKALSVLDKYASKLEQNAQILFEEGILKWIVPLLTHPELYIQRFAIKLLSELCFLSPVAEVLLKEGLIHSTMEILNRVDDLVVKEFSSSIIRELTRSKAGHSQLVKSKPFPTLIHLLSSPDPDIQKNSLQVIFNMIQDPYDHTLLTGEPDFTVKVLIDLLMSEYMAIQNLSLDILNILTQQRKGNTIPKDFQDIGGVVKILTILKIYEWKDMHSKCLEVLSNIYDNPNMVQHFLKDGVLQLFNYMDLINDPHLRRRAVEVIAKITETSLGRKVLVESDLVARMLEMLLEQSVGMTAAVCHSVAGLVQNYDALQQVLAHSTVSDLLTIMVDEERGWDSRTAAVHALYQILKRDPFSCTFIVESGRKDVFATFLSHLDERMPTHAATMACNCITTLAGHSELRQKMISPELIYALLHCFQDSHEDTTVLKLSACEALCSLLSEPETRKCLTDLNGLSIVWASITRYPNNIQFLQSAANFVHLCITNDKSFTSTLLELGVLNWLLSQRSLRSECPVWEVALETVFNKFLPIKFALTGRLDLTDITENNFYITKVPLTREQINKNQFPILNVLISNVSCPIQTLYIANFNEGGVSQSSLPQGAGFVRSSKTVSIQSKTSKKSSGSLTLSYDCEKLRSGDSYLQKYIHSLKTIFNQNGFSAEDSCRKDSVEDGDCICRKSLLIGQFVANQMSGTDKAESCSAHMLELHINELKVEIMNNIIPVGYMRVGLQLERAFLFKVLADRVGLSAALVRGRYGQRAWVEVAIPNIPPTPRPSYPNYLLKPNHVVDLISAPVALYPLNSYEADVYCGKI